MPLSEKLLVFLRCQVALDLAHPLALEIFRDEFPVVHLEIVLHVLQGRLVVFHHQVGVFAHDMHLLDFLSIELVEHTVVVLLVSGLVVFYPSDVHGVVEHKESAFEFERADFRQVQEGLFHVFQLQVFKMTEEGVGACFDLVQEFDHGELDCLVCRVPFFRVGG